ncbi:MAG: glutamate-1-semialdehyde 2,1-aminomutase [Chloroflexi bacterium]|nr:glutamate-1-semialdehyde 2,1-aminomutase [Chloroflexota bacterium]
MSQPRCLGERPEGSQSAVWRTRAEAVFPGGVNSPVRAWQSVGGVPPILVRGKGASVWDADGRAYLDYVGAFGPHLLGHAHAAIVRAIRDIAAQGGPFGSTHPAEVTLAERIRAAIPAIERIRFTSSGTEAAMGALRVARAATGRRFILKFAGAYHGHADGLLARAGSGVASLSVPDSAGVDPDIVSRTLIAPYNDIAAVEAAFHAYRGRIAAVIVEPVAANMGVVQPAPGFLEGLRVLATDDGALLIFDEVITGFRLGLGGAQARYEVTPDLTLLGKVIGGGLPIGAFGGRADLMSLVAPDGPVYQAGTLAGHPLAMAAGEAMLTKLTPGLYRRLERTACRLERGLRQAAVDAGATASLARVGSLLTVFFRRHAPRDLGEAEAADRMAFRRFHAALTAGGVLVPASPFEAWFVSAAHTKADVDDTVSVARAAFAAAAASSGTRTRTTGGGS